jgi:HAD superfamily hydrolase (TIGR01484 family)
MRIAVSDYDGTMAHNGKLLGDVVGSVKKWRRQGNRFGIATGRDRSMIASEIERWGIPVDFVICANGATVFDSDTTLLYKRFIPDRQIPLLLRHPAALASMHAQISDTGPLRVILGPQSWFPRIGVKYAEVARDEAVMFTNLAQISFAYTNEGERALWEARLREDFGDAIAVHPNKTTIDLNASGVDKANGIGELIRLNGWEDLPLLVIGDGGNDLGMIRRFSGYTVPGAQEDVVRAAKRVCADLEDMLANE